MGLHVALLTQVSSPLGARKEGAVVAWFSVAIPNLASSPSAAARRWQSISQLSVRSRPPRPCALSAVLGTSRPPLWLGIVVAGALLVVEASVVDLLTHTAAHGTFGLVFLLGVLVISAGWGMGLAVVMTLASAAVYAYFHVGYFHVGASGLVRISIHRMFTTPCRNAIQRGTGADRLTWWNSAERRRLGSRGLASWVHLPPVRTGGSGLSWVGASSVNCLRCC